MEDAEGPQRRHLHVLLPHPPVHARRFPRPAVAPASSSRAALTGFDVAAPPARWAALGFAVGEGDVVAVGGIAVRLGRSGEGLVGWSVDPEAAVGDGAIDGIATAAAPAPPQAASHPNGCVAIDHVVVATPDLDRTCAALSAAGFEERRRREAGSVRQAFHLAGPTIIEVAGPCEPDGTQAASLWGLTFVVEDLDATAAALGDQLGKVRDAVQPGRRIATVRRQAGAGVPLALITGR